MPTFTLSAAPRAEVRVPELTAEQQAVVSHAGGPLLVLAGPGTGKTTTLVEAVVDRVVRRGQAPESVLTLTFSRKAAEQLRDRITARLGRTTAVTPCSTFHSFAYSLVRRYSPAEIYAAPLTLLSAPEQDLVLRQLLSDAPESVRWPEGFRAAVGTRGFARELSSVLSRARERGLDGPALSELGRHEGRPELEIAGLFLDQYLDVLDSLGALDYADLVQRAVGLAEEHREELRAELSCVMVDEYQDTDPSQVALLRALAGDGRDLVVVGDPDQSIYGFRGAEVRGILDFPAAFVRADQTKADVIALRHTRRYGPRLAAAVRRISSSIGVAGSIDVATFRAFRDPEAVSGPHGEGRVEVLTFDTPRAETEHVADLLRRAHLVDEVPWSQMAVLVRSGRGSIPSLRRALSGAGVPVEVAADDTPLVQERSVQPLLDGLRAVLHLRTPLGEADEGEGTDGIREWLDPRRAESMLLSPLGGLDALELRAVSRTLRAAERASVLRDGGSPRSSPLLLREALVDPALLDPEDAASRRVRDLALLLADARRLTDEGATPEEVLWRLWSGTRWPERLRRNAAGTGPGSRPAHRDLDAICALFETAARAEEQHSHRGLEEFLRALEAQQLPGDTMAEAGVRGEGVRLLTAHRAKGLEWRLVVVAHVQEQTWPDVRRRATLLPAERIAADGLRDPVGLGAMLAEERRLFYVACTRARERLVVTAVRSPEDDGDQPSRFLAELLPGHTDARHQQGRPRRPLSLTGLVADLRRTVTDPATSPPLRAAAARRLAGLASIDADGSRTRALVPAADPASWWGTRTASRSPTPWRREDAVLALSASTLQQVLACPMQWFLEREAGGSQETSSSQGVGLVVHALADRVARGELAEVVDLFRAGRRDEALAALMTHVDGVWGQISFRTPWSAGREREAVRDALGRFLRWHLDDRGRRLVGSETGFEAEVGLPDGSRVLLRGYADRVEVDQDGALVVVDLKTGKKAPTGEELREHVQLGLYQHAARHGAFEEAAPGVRDCSGAELVQLRASPSAEQPKVQQQPPQPPDEDGTTLVERQLLEVSALIRDEQLVARPGKQCDRCAFVAICPVQGGGTVFDG